MAEQNETVILQMLQNITDKIDDMSTRIADSRETQAGFSERLSAIESGFRWLLGVVSGVIVAFVGYLVSHH